MFQKIKKILPKSEFAKNVLTLMTGTTIAQAIPIAISPILTRIYSPEDFGVFALYISISSLISSISTGRYEHAVMLPKSDEEALSLVLLSSILSTIVSLLVLILVLLFNDQISFVLGSKEISNWLYVLPVSVFLTGVYQGVNYWGIRTKSFKTISIAKVSHTSVGAITNLSMAFFELKGLIPSSILGQLTSLIVQLKKISFKKSVFRFNLVFLAKKYNKFPKYDVPTAVVSSLNNNVFIMLFSSFFGDYLLGFYSFAKRILFTPSTLLSSSLSDVFYQRLSYSYTNQNYKQIERDIELLAKKLFLWLTIPFFLVIFLSKYYVSFVFGDKWLNLYKYLYILSILVYINMTVTPLSYMLKVYSLQHISLKQHVKVVFFKGLVLLIAILKNFSFEITLFLLIIVHVIITLVNMIEIFNKTKNKMPKWYKIIFLVCFFILNYVYYEIT